MVKEGLHHQYKYSTLYLNQGVINGELPWFSDAAWIAGVTSTDWSWAALFADFDLDGWKDLYITNGSRRDINNIDYFNQMQEAKTNGNPEVTYGQLITNTIQNHVAGDQQLDSLESGDRRDRPDGSEPTVACANCESTAVYVTGDGTFDLMDKESGRVHSGLNLLEDAEDIGDLDIQTQGRLELGLAVDVHDLPRDLRALIAGDAPRHIHGEVAVAHGDGPGSARVDGAGGVAAPAAAEYSSASPGAPWDVSAPTPSPNSTARTNGITTRAPLYLVATTKPMATPPTKIIPSKYWKMAAATTSPPPPWNFDSLPGIHSERPLFDEKYPGVGHGPTPEPAAESEGAAS